MHDCAPHVQHPSGDIPDRLGVARDFASSRYVATRVLIALLLLSLLPRFVAAWKLEPVSSDAYYYIASASSLEDGNVETAFSYLKLNIYPVILAQLHRLGLDWIVGAKLWGALMGGLVVLPLFGWVRRLFDDRIAALACFLYAIDPELIELSVEPMRESTFWLLLAVSLYFQRRCVEEKRPWLFALAGVGTAAAIHTRSEGWLLCLPLVVWAFVCWRRREPSSGKLWLGIPLAAAMTPALIIVFNLTVLHSQSKWDWGRLQHAAIAYQWLASSLGWEESASGPKKAANVAPKPPGAVRGGAGRSSARHSHAGLGARVSQYVDGFVQSLGPINLALLAIGLVHGRRMFFQGEKLALLLVALAIMLAVWMRLWESGGMNGRWFFTAMLVLLPFESLGMLAIAEGLDRLVPPISDMRLKRRVIACLAVLTVVCWGDMLTTSHPSRESQKVAGDWLRDRCGPFDLVVVNRGAERVGYYAGEAMPKSPPKKGRLVQTIESLSPNLVVLTKKDTSTSEMELAAACVTCERLGLSRIAVPDLADEFVVFSREPSMRARISDHSLGTPRRN
ncbi:MAG: hypothetical protein CMJ48_06430 [Planctomycetaceae bacterium]|nr:hypothetical protein [Planctomycetaceae bacterium]